MFFVNLISVALRAYQQLNVIYGEYGAIVPISYGMAVMLVLTTLGIVELGKDIKKQAIGIVCIGTGAWIGSWIAMYLHAMLF